MRSKCPRCGSEFVMQFPWGSMCCAQECAHKWNRPEPRKSLDDLYSQEMMNYALHIAGILGIPMTHLTTWDSLIDAVALVVKERDDLVSWKNRHMVKDGSGGYVEIPATRPKVYKAQV